MNRRRRRVNWFLVMMLALLIASGIYFNARVVNNIDPLFVPTPTATRAPESFVVEAETLFAQGRLLQAIEAYKQAIFVEPNTPAVYIALARVQILANLPEDAQVNAEYALLLNPNNSMAHALRAWALSIQGSYLEAEASVKRALEIDPNNGIAHAIYAIVLSDQVANNLGTLDAIERAAENSRVALNLAPNTIEAHFARGYVLEVTANYELAIAEFQAAININSNIAFLHLALGRNYRILGVYDKAVSAFTSANALNPADPLPDLYISRTYYRIRDDAKAEQYAENAVTDAPADAYLRGNWGVLLYRIAEFPEAAKQLSYAIYGGQTEDGALVKPLAIINDERILEIFYIYGFTLIRLDRCGDAIEIFRIILESAPGNEIAVFNAQEGLRQCQEKLSITPTPIVFPTSTPAP